MEQWSVGGFIMLVFFLGLMLSTAILAGNLRDVKSERDTLKIQLNTCKGALK